MLLFIGQGLAQTFNGRDIFRKIDLEVQVGEKIALVGPNGIGKTSLFRIIAGVDRPAAGYLQFFSDPATVFLTQNPDFPEGSMVRSLLTAASEQVVNPPSITEVLKRFRFQDMEDQTVQRLSGGEKTRLQLACLWMNHPGLLLLDEPTNHLDVDHLNWLENFVTGYPGTIILVSHDRYFLDHTITRILELGSGGLVSYPGNYTDYARRKTAQYVQDLKTYFDQEKQTEKLNQVIQAQYQWAAKAHRDAPKKAKLMGRRKGGKEFLRAKAKKMDKRVKSNIHRLERLREQRISKPQTRAKIDLSFLPPKQRRQAILLAEGIAKSFGNRALFASVSLTLQPTEKVALIGPNGSGKTTLLKILLGTESFDGAPESGTIWRSPSLKIGYLEQELLTLQAEQTVISEMAMVTNDLDKARSLLAGLLLKGDAVLKPCAVLSMGERVRVALAKLLLGTYDLLLLDEPTNYLDLESREKIEEALIAFPGALIVAAHDRYFLDKVCNTVWSMMDGTVKVYPGRYSEFKEYRETNLKK